MAITRKPSVVEQIAADAGVSRAAAYAVLNPGKPSTIGVSAAKRKQILAAAKKVGYVRNDLARSLVTGRTNTIGLCVQSLRDHFFTEFFTVFDDLASRAGKATFFASGEFDADREKRILNSFLAKRVDAMVVAGYNLAPMKARLRRYVDSGGVILFLRSVLLEDQPEIAFDETRAVSLQAEHLAALGHTRVAYVNASLARDMRVEMHRNRALFFSKVWTRLTGHVPENLAGDNPVRVDDVLADKVIEGRYTAVACANDTLAMSLISVLGQKGIRAPDDISVMGHDDVFLSRMFAPPLTTVRLPVAPLARESWRIIAEALGSDAESVRPERVVIRPELVVRLSTAAPKE